LGEICGGQSAQRAAAMYRGSAETTGFRPPMVVASLLLGKRWTSARRIQSAGHAGGPSCQISEAVGKLGHRSNATDRNGCETMAGIVSGRSIKDHYQTPPDISFECCLSPPTDAQFPMKPVSRIVFPVAAALASLLLGEPTS